jgi:hypothetical protein
MGQTNAFVLLAVVLALMSVDRRPAVSGLSLGFAFNIKFQVLAFVPYLLLRRRWAAASWFFLGTLMWSVLPALATGWRANARDLGTAYSGVLDLLGFDTGLGVRSKHRVGDSFSLSACSAIARMVGPAHEQLAFVLSATLVLLCIGAAWFMYRRAGVALIDWPAANQMGSSPWSPLTLVEWAGLAVIALVFSPQTNSRHLVLLTLPVSCAAALALGDKKCRTVASLSIVLLVMGIDLPTGAGKKAMWWWRGWGVEAGCILLSFALLLWAVLAHTRRYGKSDSLAGSCESYRQSNPESSELVSESPRSGRRSDTSPQREDWSAHEGVACQATVGVALETSEPSNDTRSCTQS